MTLCLGLIDCQTGGLIADFNGSSPERLTVPTDSRCSAHSTPTVPKKTTRKTPTMCSRCKDETPHPQIVRADQSAEEEPRRRSAPKNTRKWCKGKVGREHIPSIIKKPTWGDDKCHYSNWKSARTGRFLGYWICNHREICERCGKVLKWRVDCPERD